jgi:uncharacterized membrane protein SpoIIM required for sporulation
MMPGGEATGPGVAGASGAATARANRTGSVALAIAVVAAALCVAVLVSADYGMSILAQHLKDAVAQNAEPSRGELAKVDEECRAAFARTSPLMSLLADSGLLLLAALVFAGACTAVIGLTRAGSHRKSSLAALVLCVLIIAAYVAYSGVRRAQMQKEIPGIPSWYWAR